LVAHEKTPTDIKAEIQREQGEHEMKMWLLRGTLVVAVLGLAGCGGGGGGGGSDISASYKGSTSQATVTTSNAKAVSVDAVQGVQNIATAGVLGKQVDNTSEATPQIQSIAKVLEESVVNIATKNVAKTVAVTVQDTIYGYSGSASFTINGNDSSGAFSGTITFSSYVESLSAPVISGAVTFSGAANTSTGTITSINMSLSNLRGVIGSQPYTLNGSIAISSGSSSKTLNISVVRTEDTNSRTYWAKDFSFVLTGNRMSVSGTYYDHVNGYVAVTTLTPLTVSTYSSTPTSGQLLFTGSNGSKARLTYTYTGYTLEIDASGNNTYVVVP